MLSRHGGLRVVRCRVRQEVVRVEVPVGDAALVTRWCCATCSRRCGPSSRACARWSSSGPTAPAARSTSRPSAERPAARPGVRRPRVRPGRHRPAAADRGPRGRPRRRQDGDQGPAIVEALRAAPTATARRSSRGPMGEGGGAAGPLARASVGGATVAVGDCRRLAAWSSSLPAGPSTGRPGDRRRGRRPAPAARRATAARGRDVVVVLARAAERGGRVRSLSKIASSEAEGHLGVTTR